MTKTPERTLYLHDDREVVVRFDYDKGEREWFDHKAGVGGPGSDPKVEITEIDLGDGFVPPNRCGLPERIITGLESQLLDRIQEEQAEIEQRRADYEYDACREQGMFK